MFKLYRKYRKLQETKLKYQEFQHLTGRILKVDGGIKLYKLEYDIHGSRLLYPKDKNKLLQLCELKRSQIIKKVAEKHNNERK